MAYNITKLQNDFQKESKFSNEINNIGDIVSRLIPYIFGIAGIALLLMIIFSGFQMLTSAGDPKALESAQKRLVNAIIGFVIIFAAYWIIQFIGKILGIEVFGTIFGQ